MRQRMDKGLLGSKRNEFPATVCAFTDILVIEEPDDRRGIQILQPGQILLTAQEVPAQGDLTVLAP